MLRSYYEDYYADHKVTVKVTGRIYGFGSSDSRLPDLGFRAGGLKGCRVQPLPGPQKDVEFLAFS